MKQYLHKIRGLRESLLAVSLLTSATAFAGTETLVRSYDLNTLEVSATQVDGTAYSMVRYGDLYQTKEVGIPDLPVEYVNFIVPTASKDFTATVTVKGEIRTVSLSAPVMPAQHPIPNNGRNIPEFVAIDRVVYERPCPARAEVVEDAFIDGCNHVVTVAVYPVSYSEKDRTVTAASQVEVSLDYRTCSLTELDRQPIFPPVQSPYFNMEDIVDNTRSVAACAPRRAVSVDSSPRYYYIITPRNLKTPLQYLATWKAQKGYSVTIKCIEDIYADSKYAIGSRHTFTNGTTEEIVDSAAALRAYLKDEYISKGTYFCLLVGDYKTSMPIRYARKYRYQPYEYDRNIHGDNYVPTDAYFSDFTTKWDLKPCQYNPIYTDSEKSYAPDIVIGRLLCSRQEEVKNYLRKLIIYESNPGLGDASYLQNFVYFEQDRVAEGEDEDGKKYYYRSGGMLGEASTVRRSFDPFPETTTLISDSCFFDSCYYSRVPHFGSDLMRSIGKAGFSSWHAHGSPGAMECCAYWHYFKPISTYTKEMVNKENNDNDDYGNGLDFMSNAGKPQVAYSISCTISPFDQYVAGTKVNGENRNGFIYDLPYNFGSSFTIAGDYGGPAILCNTRSGYVGSSAEMEAIFGDYILKQPKIGIAEALSKYSYGDSHLSATHHLIGEPEFEMWLNLPNRFENLTVKLENGNVKVSDTELIGSKISVYTGHGIPYSRIGNSTLMEHPFSSNLNDFALSIWKTGFLPIIRLYSFQGTVSNQTKYYLVQDAFLGNPVCVDPTNQNLTTRIGKGTKYSVNAINSITAYTGFIIDNGADVTLECEKTVTLSCTVKAGGKLTVKAKDVKMTANFTVEKGGVVEINKK